MPRAVAENVDPFTAEMIKNGLVVACEEMFYAFGRTAMSPVIYEVLDYAVGIATAAGELVAQTPGVPGFSGVLDFVAADVLEKWRKEMRPGDVYILNIPYRSGTHLNDVALVLPSFHKDRLIGLILNKGHWSEVGGMHFGSWTSDATEIFQEGMQFPNIRLYIEGKPNRDLIEMIRANSRLPDQTFGDMEAQVASMKVADRRIQKLIEKYGVDVILSSMDKLLEDGEKLAALKLKGLPKGTFEAEDWIDDDGITDDPLYVKAKVTITEDSFVADFSGSAPQGKGSINSPLPATVSGVRETYMAVMDPHALPNAGFFRPIRVVAPPGSVFNATHPAPTSTYWESMSYAVDLVWKALAPHVPDRLSAGHFLSILATILAGVDDRTREPFAVVEPQPGGWGAQKDADGESGLVACGDGETYIASNEVYERNMPILVDRYELNIAGGTGHGRFRGGFGVIKDYVVRCPEASFTVSVGRAKYPPWGVDGGSDGTPNTCVVFKHGKEPIVTRKVGGLRLVKGEKVSLRSGGGGGWGPPLERDPELVRSDVKNEYITSDQAKDIYGVVIRDNRVDVERTNQKRRELRKGPGFGDQGG